MGRYFESRGMGIVELAPKRCPSGHPLGPQQVLVGSHPCSCSEKPHRTWQCVRCSVVMVWPVCEQHPKWVLWEGAPD